MKKIPNSIARKAGERIEFHLFPERAHFIFMYILSVEAILVSAAFMVFKPTSSVLFALMLVLVSGCLILIRYFDRREPRSLALHENGLVIERYGGFEFIPWSCVKDVHVRDAKSRYGFPYYQITFEKQKPLALNPVTDSGVIVDHLVRLIIEKSGMGRAGARTPF